MMELKRVCVVFRNQEVLQTKSWVKRTPDPDPKPKDPPTGPEEDPVIESPTGTTNE
uniref:hypothetical protein n=1 Tax=Roseivirga sp. TaxID=1964215 RepID=UPI0040487BA5